VLLITSTPTSPAIASLQKDVEAVLRGARARVGAVVDGADAGSKATRDEAFAATGVRSYPQVLARAVGGGALRALVTVEALMAANEDKESGALAATLKTVTA